MELGFALPTSGSWATPDNQTAIATRAESLGYRGVWSFQRLLRSGPPEDAFGGSADGVWPAYYTQVLDPLVSLAFVAAVTTRIRLGVAVLNGPFYSPALLAKMLSSLDVISGGRLEAGIGLGWSRAEYQASGLSYSGRGRRLDELLACLDALLTSDKPAFAGRFYSLPSGIVMEPKPVQQPRPPILIGGGSEAAFVRAVSLGDGWVSSSTAGLDGVSRGVSRLRALAEERDRPPGATRVVSRGVVRLRERPGTAPLEGPLGKLADDLGRFSSAGVDEVFLDLNFDPEIGSADADPGASMERAAAVMEAMASWR